MSWTIVLLCLNSIEPNVPFPGWAFTGKRVQAGFASKKECEEKIKEEYSEPRSILGCPKEKVTLVCRVRGEQ